MYDLELLLGISEMVNHGRGLFESDSTYEIYTSIVRELDDEDCN